MLKVSALFAGFLGLIALASPAHCASTCTSMAESLISLNTIAPPHCETWSQRVPQKAMPVKRLAEQLAEEQEDDDSDDDDLRTVVSAARLGTLPTTILNGLAVPSRELGWNVSPRLRSPLLRC